MTEKKKNGSGEKTRREFLKDASLLVGGTAIGSTVLLAACGGGTTDTVTSTKTVTTTAGAGETATITQTETTTQDVSHFVCPESGCGAEFDSLSELQGHVTTEHAAEAEKFGYGWFHYLYPSGVATVETDEAKCTGCLNCSLACSMKHFGVLNKDLGRIQTRMYLTPLIKAFHTTCSQCDPPERECDTVCPTDPKSIYFDEETLHMVIDYDTCLGEGCLLCREACSAKAIRFLKGENIVGTLQSSKPFVCDLCDTENTGDRDPECIKVCPTDALYFKNEDDRGRPIRDVLRRHPDEKAKWWGQRLYPMKDGVHYLRR